MTWDSTSLHRLQTIDRSGVTAHLNEEFDVDYCDRHVRRVLSEAGLTWKTARPQFDTADERAREAWQEGFKKGGRFGRQLQRLLDEVDRGEEVPIGAHKWAAGIGLAVIVIALAALGIRFLLQPMIDRGVPRSTWQNRRRRAGKPDTQLSDHNREGPVPGGQQLTRRPARGATNDKRRILLGWGPQFERRLVARSWRLDWLSRPAGMVGRPRPPADSEEAHEDGCSKYPGEYAETGFDRRRWSDGGRGWGRRRWGSPLGGRPRWRPPVFAGPVTGILAPGVTCIAIVSPGRGPASGTGSFTCVCRRPTGGGRGSPGFHYRRL